MLGEPETEQLIISRVFCLTIGFFWIFLSCSYMKEGMRTSVDGILLVNLFLLLATWQLVLVYILICFHEIASIWYLSASLFESLFSLIWFCGVGRIGITFLLLVTRLRGGWQLLMHSNNWCKRNLCNCIYLACIIQMIYVQCILVFSSRGNTYCTSTSGYVNFLISACICWNDATGNVLCILLSLQLSLIHMLALPIQSTKQWIYDK